MSGSSRLTGGAETRSRTAWALYLVALAIPMVALSWLNASEIASWLTTGMCPGGPMDRVAAPCGALEFVSIELLGGWVDFIVVPALVGWTLAVTLAFRRAGKTGPRSA